MKCFSYGLAWAAVVLAGGCGGSESTSSPPAATVRAESPGKSDTVQPETSPPVAAPEPSDGSPGLAIGARAPAFELKDQHGQSRSLAEILESGHAALVFYRSADW